MTFLPAVNMYCPGGQVLSAETFIGISTSMYAITEVGLSIAQRPEIVSPCDMQLLADQGRVDCPKGCLTKDATAKCGRILA
jgi:hypothetical protein